MSQKKWDLWYLGLCEHVALMSRDPSTKVGSFLIDKDYRPVSFGYNGFPQGCNDDPEYYNNREVKYRRIIHSEIQCIIFAKRDLAKCTIYTTPIPSCSNCTSALLQAGVIRFVSWDNDINNPRWAESFKEAKRLCTEKGAVIDLYHKEKNDGKS